MPVCHYSRNVFVNIYHIKYNLYNNLAYKNGTVYFHNCIKNSSHKASDRTMPTEEDLKAIVVHKKYSSSRKGKGESSRKRKRSSSSDSSSISSGIFKCKLLFI